MSRIITIVAAFIFLGTSAAAQHKSTAAGRFTLGVTDKIRSSVLSEDRILNIYLPGDYEKDKGKKYPVLYLLDGSVNEDFIHICGIVQFLNMIEFMPPTIVVGVANVDRKRDFTFPTTIAKDKADFPTTGGSAKFIRFTEQELLPYVRSHYRVNDSTTLIGQSLGGLLASQILLEKPQLFGTYIIVSPSLWWDNESLLARAPALISAFGAAKPVVYLAAGGAEEDIMQKDAQKLCDLLRQHTRATVSYNSEPNESHLTILHNCIYHALVKLNGKQ